MFPRSIARLAALQAVCQQILCPHEAVTTILTEFLHERFTPFGYNLASDLLEGQSFKVDRDFFQVLLLGVHQHAELLDTWIATALPEKWQLNQLEAATHAILRCAAFEILEHPDTPKEVIFNEYITAAHIFLPDKGYGLINAILEKLYPVITASHA